MNANINEYQSMVLNISPRLNENVPDLKGSNWKNNWGWVACRTQWPQPILTPLLKVLINVTSNVVFNICYVYYMEEVTKMSLWDKRVTWVFIISLTETASASLKLPQKRRWKLMHHFLFQNTCPHALVYFVCRFSGIDCYCCTLNCGAVL